MFWLLAMTRFCLPLLPSYFGDTNLELVDVEKIARTVKHDLDWDPLRTLEINRTELAKTDVPYQKWAACEVWLDYLQGDVQDLVKQLLKTHRTRVIFLFRRLQLEESRMHADLAERLIAQIAHEGGWLDLDVHAQARELTYFRRAQEEKTARARLIASYHNYQATPPLAQLEKIVESMRAFEPEVYKLATFCRTKQDALDLLTLLNLMQEQGMNAIVLGMGAHGLATRIIGTIWGNYLCFAPESADTASAPGQLTYDQMQNILNTLESGARNAG